jgi:GxxExxY protein
MGEILHKELSYRVVGCAQRVHGTLGMGYPEHVYHQAMETELRLSGIPFETEKVITVLYRGEICGQFRLDLVADGKIVLELKALSGLCDEHTAQALSYLKASDLRLGILMNFGATSLQTKRVVL